MALRQLATLTSMLLLRAAISLIGSEAAVARGGRELHFKWEIGYLSWNPDCGGDRVMIGINGKVPGPTIWAKAGDNVIVVLKNRLHNERVMIHWRGVMQYDTPWLDGTASNIPQCTMDPKEKKLTYRFQVDRPGTFFYHADLGRHHAMGLYGSLIVDVADGWKEPFHYDGEFSLLLSDLYHRDIFSPSSDPFRWMGEPQSILVNGRGQFNCSLAATQLEDKGLGSVPGPVGACFISSPQCQPVILHVKPNKTYRIRVASITLWASLNMVVSDHKLVVVEAAGYYVNPFTADSLDVISGESYSILLTTTTTSSANHWLSVAVRGHEPTMLPTLAVLNYFPISALKLPASPPPIHPLLSDYIILNPNFSNKTSTSIILWASTTIMASATVLIVLAVLFFVAILYLLWFFASQQEQVLPVGDGERPWIQLSIRQVFLVLCVIISCAMLLVPYAVTTPTDTPDANDPDIFFTI